TMVVIDDAIALTVIAVVYTTNLAVAPLLVAFGCVLAVVALSAAGVRHGAAYFLIGAAMWMAMLASGVHATIAGVVMGLLATAYPPTRQELSRAGTTWREFREDPTPELARSASRTLANTVSPNERLQH